jgi:hypothetical protein
VVLDLFNTHSLLGSDVKQGRGKNGARLIFDGSTPFEDFEKEEILNFKQHMKAKKLPEPEFVTDSMILRYIQACGWKKDKTYQSLIENAKFLKSLPANLTQTTLKYLVNALEKHA